MNRTEILREMGITPMWRARDAAPPVDAGALVAVKIAPANAGKPSAGKHNAGKPLVQAVLRGRSSETGLQSASSASALVESSDERAALIARMDWPELKDAVANCRACALCNGRNHTVFGAGDEKARWLIIGEAPGQEEDRLGEPFVGQAGKLLDSMLAALDLTRNVNVYIANVLKCRPPGNRDPQPAEVAQCSPHLLRQIELLQPSLIVLMGRFAAQTILATDASIASLRGRVFTYRGTPAIVTYHPAYLLRSLTEKARAWEDLLFARDTFSGAAAGAAAAP